MPGPGHVTDRPLTSPPSARAHELSALIASTSPASPAKADRARVPKVGRIAHGEACGIGAGRYRQPGDRQPHTAAAPQVYRGDCLSCLAKMFRERPPRPGRPFRLGASLLPAGQRANTLHRFCTHFSAIRVQFPVMFGILLLTRFFTGSA
jgi:hypothetical protein